MSNSVLCAVDISNQSDDYGVLKMAAKLAEMEGAQLDVITVIPDYGMSVVASFFDESHHEKMVEESKSKLAKAVTDVLGAKQSQKVRHIVSTGKTYEEILNAAKLAKSSLIVVGAHKTDLKDYLLGPNAARVVRHSDCSVHVVR